MKNLSKKQIIGAGAVAILAIGGVSAGVISHNNTVHAQQVAKNKAHDAKVKADKKAKAEKLGKEKETAQQKIVSTLLATATVNPSDNAIKAVNDAVAKLTDPKEKSKDTELVKGLNARLALIKKAQAAVKDYQGHATDANKQKVAQAEINNLKDKNDQDVKAELQKLFDASNKQAQDSAKASQAQQSSSKTAAQTSSNSENQGTSQQVSNGYQAPATNVQTPNYGGGNPSSNAGASNSNNGSGNSTGGGTAPSHPGGDGSIEDLDNNENQAGNAGTDNAINKQPGDKW